MAKNVFGARSDLVANPRDRRIEAGTEVIEKLPKIAIGRFVKDIALDPAGSLYDYRDELERKK